MNRRLRAVALFVGVVVALVAPSAAHSSGPWPYAQECVGAGRASDPPSCRDSTLARDGRLYYALGAGAGAPGVSAGAATWSVIGEDVVAPHDAYLEVRADVSQMTPPEVVVQPGLSVIVNLTCVRVINKTRSMGTGSCYSGAWDVFRRWPTLEVDEGDELHAEALLFPIWPDRAAVCLPPFGNCLAGAGGPALVSGKFEGFRFEFRPRRPSSGS